MIKWVPVLLFSLFFSFRLVCAPAIEWDEGSKNVRTVGLVDEAAMTPDGIERIYQGLDWRSHVRSRIVVLTAFRNHAAVRYLQLPRLEASCEDDIQTLRELRAQGPLAVTKLVAIGADVVVQMTDGYHATRRILRGKDPTVFQIGQRRCQLVNLYIVRLPHALRPHAPNPPIVSVNIMSDKLPTVAEAQGITNWIVTISGAAAARISIRDDPRFLDLPLIYPFVPYTEPPSRSEYYTHESIYCKWDQRRASCAIEALWPRQ
ncbi:MAG TPA: hypothetical protein VHD76_10860 [Bryobacteraceae bacterium]|jgi:hypothetical protein|nr:hypothetical protein [Bryobacteraceae bacterium]